MNIKRRLTELEARAPKPAPGEPVERLSYDGYKFFRDLCGLKALLNEAEFLARSAQTDNDKWVFKK